MNRIADHTKVAAYLSAVRSHMEDLPPHERDDLLDDLADHLREVQAEDEGSLEDRLGPPDAYAAELRVSAGLLPVPRRRRGLFAQLRQSLNDSAPAESLELLAASRRVQEAKRFMDDLKPGWWVVRGFLVTIVLAGVRDLQLEAKDFPVPSISGSHLIGLALTVLFTWGSVMVGRRTPQERRARTLSTVVNVVVVALAGIIWVNVMDTVRVESQVVVTQAPWELSHPDGSAIRNICPYTPDGQPIDGVLLFDHQGRPITNVSLHEDSGAGNIFPRRPVPGHHSAGTHETLSCPAFVAPSPADPAGSGGAEAPVDEHVHLDPQEQEAPPAP